MTIRSFCCDEWTGFCLLHLSSRPPNFHVSPPFCIVRCKPTSQWLHKWLLSSFTGTYALTRPTAMKILIVLASLLCIATAGRDVLLSMQIPFTGAWPGGPKMASSLLIAIDTINNDPTLLPENNVTWVLRDDQCTQRASTLLIDDYTDLNPPIDAVIGPGCSSGCLPAGYVAAHFNIPMISWGCVASVLSDKNMYPTFARTGSSFSFIGLYFKQLMQHYNWKRMNLVCATQALWSQICNTFKIHVETNTSLSVPYLGSFDPYSTSDHKLESMLSFAKEKAHSKYQLLL